MSEQEIPTINIKLEERVVEPKTVHSSWMIIETPYMIVVDKNGKKKVWTKDKKKIILYYLYKITGIKWFIKNYQRKRLKILNTFKKI